MPDNFFEGMVDNLGEQTPPADNSGQTQPNPSDTNNLQGGDPNQQQTDPNLGTPGQQGDPSLAPQEGQPGQAPPKLYAGKYKSPEELEEAYRNTSGEAMRMAAQLKQANTLLQRMAPPPQQQQPLSPDDANRAFLSNFAKDPIGTVQKAMGYAIQPIQQTMLVEKVNSTIEHMSKNPDTYPGFGELRGEMADLLDDPKNKYLWDSEDPIGDAYGIAFARNLPKMIAIASKGRQQGAAQGQTQVRGAQVTSPAGNSGRQPGQQGNITAEQKIINGILGVRDPVNDFFNS